MSTWTHGEIQRDKASGQREVLQKAGRRAHNRRRVRARADCLGGFQMQNAGRLSRSLRENGCRPAGGCF